MKELKFRTLYADEIEVRSHVYKDGVSLILHKDARADQNILDEAVGPTGWQRHHLRNNANCIVAIYDDTIGEWVEKEDVGSKSKDEAEKGLASDSFKRACVNWGIGRELYTSPDMYIPKEELKGYEANENGTKCNSIFSVQEIEYTDDRKIASVTIEASYDNTVYLRKTFEGGKRKVYRQTPDKQAEYNQPASSNSKNSKPINMQQNKPVIPDGEPVDNTLSDDEVLLIGNCRGKRYGDVKNTETFMSFLKWTRNSNSQYDIPAQQEQFTKLKALATSMNFTGK